MPITGNRTSTGARGPCAEKHGERQFIFLTLLSFSSIAASVLILKFAPAPFFWFWLTVAATLWSATIGIHGSWHRAILFNLGILMCLLAGAEAYLVTHEYTTTIFSDDFLAPDDLLGWAPPQATKAHAFKARSVGLFHGPVGVLFNVDYTIDSDGLRVAPPYRKDDLTGTAIFFGCSFTFGEGLKDEETLPYLVGSQSGGRYRTFNFAFEGYSPAHMLAEIEHGMVQRVVDTTPQYAYYVAIPNHVWRVAGRVPWGGHAPRYVLDTDGTLNQAGNLGNRKPLALRLGLGSRVDRQLRKSAMWRMLSMSDARITEDDFRTYFAVVRRSQVLLTAQYPGIQFRVILWPNQHVAQERATYDRLREEFSRMGIPVDLVEDILPGYSADRSPYILSSTDHHPSALANRLLAQYVLSEILKDH
jgi:hypothetical protein